MTLIRNVPYGKSAPQRSAAQFATTYRRLAPSIAPTAMEAYRIASSTASVIARRQLGEPAARTEDRGCHRAPESTGAGLPWKGRAGTGSSSPSASASSDRTGISGRKKVWAMSVGTTALPITTVTRMVYCV